MVERTATHIRLAGPLALIVLIAAGCGGTSKPSVASLGSTTTAAPTSGGSSEAAATGSGNTPALKFAHCMRSHGVPNWPDPGGSFPAGIKQLPAFQPAMDTCNTLQGVSQSTGPSFTQAQRNAALAQAKCIRDHGVPNFPDPTFPSSGGELFPAVPGFDANSPTFKHVAAACGFNGSVGQPKGG